MYLVSSWQDLHSWLGETTCLSLCLQSMVKVNWHLENTERGGSALMQAVYDTWGFSNNFSLSSKAFVYLSTIYSESELKLGKYRERWPISDADCVQYLRLLQQSQSDLPSLSMKPLVYLSTIYSESELELEKYTERWSGSDAGCLQYLRLLQHSQPVLHSLLHVGGHGQDVHVVVHKERHQLKHQHRVQVCLLWWPQHCMLECSQHLQHHFQIVKLFCNRTDVIGFCHCWWYIKTEYYTHKYFFLFLNLCVYTFVLLFTLVFFFFLHLWAHLKSCSLWDV